ncbi:MAG: 3-hydroxyacyl-CoA dehydrogenase NAD-binding domain-containing protein [Nannocystaceae bacterium]
MSTEFKSVGVVGAGVMGAGVAQSLASGGIEVVLVDVAPAALERAMKDVRDGLRLQRMLTKRVVDVDAVLARIRRSTDLEALGAVDFVVENATERWSVKESIYRRLDAIAPAACCFAANTSAIPITRIGALTGRADRVVGMHFMNPVPMKPVVEVIRGFHTSPATLEVAKALLAAIGKEGIVVEDAPGFVSNRVLMLTINEAIFLVHEGVAEAADVDKIFKTCFGHKMGPLETADLIGLDTILLSIEVLHESFADSKYRPCPLLKKMVDAGLHGRKSGRGFYPYA